MSPQATLDLVRKRGLVELGRRLQIKRPFARHQTN